jgi:hypothetical protein
MMHARAGAFWRRLEVASATVHHVTTAAFATFLSGEIWVLDATGKIESMGAITETNRQL